MTILEKRNPKQALQAAIDFAGNQSNLAKLLGMNNPSQVSSMLNRDGQCSTKYALKISQLTHVPCHELRPDIYPEPANDDTNDGQLA